MTKTCADELAKLDLDHECGFRAALDCSPDGMVVFDARGRTHYVNAALQAMCGEESLERVGNVMSKSFYAEPELDLPRVMEQLRSSQRVNALELRVPETWRPVEWVEVSVRPLARGETVQYVATIRDVGRRRRLLQERERIIAVQQMLNESLLEGSLEETMRSVCYSLAELYSADWVGVALYHHDAEGEYFQYRWTYRVPAEIEEVRFARDGASSLTAIAAERGYGVVEDYQDQSDDDFPRCAESVRAKVRAVESVALRDRHGQLVGVLSLFSGTPGFFRKGENEISLSLVARDLANIIEAKQLEEEIRLAGITDSVTGLYNTRHFYRRLSEEMKRGERTGRPLTVMLFDLDNFKEYNDRAGHVAGDHLLRKIAEIVTSSLRTGSDLAFRYGGDEFVVLLPETDIARARRVANRIRTRVANIRNADVSVSIGLAELMGEASPEELVRRADRAMYQAKKGGKNRIRIDRPLRDG